MPLLAPVIQAARLRRKELQSAMGLAQLSSWRSMLAPRWLPLPRVERPLAGAAGLRTVNVAVDGTSHTVQLHTGAHFILAVAAAHGPAACHFERADMEILPARYEDAQASSARDLLMRSLESYAATQAAGTLAEDGSAGRATLWIDGSLYADLSHMAGAPEKVKWGTAVERAGKLLESTAALFAKAEQSDLWVIGVGKTQRASFLFDALAATAHGHGPMPVPDANGAPTRDAANGAGYHRWPGAAGADDATGLERGQGGTADEDTSGHPADGELLSAMGTGWSWPLLLDGTRFPITSRLAAQTLAGCPAIVSTYVRPHPADLPLRVDVPATLLGLPDRLLPREIGEAARPWPAWVPDPQAMQPFVEAVLGAYGGLSVYNAPLYAVDRIVRLPRRELELRYLPVCERAAGLDPGTLGINRGRRRFLIA